MKYIQGYSTFNEATKWEIPRQLMATLQRMVGIFPMLSTKWDELKKLTKDRRFNGDFISAAMYGGRADVYTMDYKLTPISKSDFPKGTQFKFFSNKWKLYREETVYKNRTRTKPSDEPDYRPEYYYISKEELKQGDRCLRFNFNHTSKDRVYKNYEPGQPIFYLTAKFDNRDDFDSNIVSTVKEIFQDFIDETTWIIQNISQDNYQDHIKIWFGPDVLEGGQSMRVFTRQEIYNLKESTEQVLDYLHGEGYEGWTCNIYFKGGYEGNSELVGNGSDADSERNKYITSSAKNIIVLFSHPKRDKTGDQKKYKGDQFFAIGREV